MPPARRRRGSSLFACSPVPKSSFGTSKIRPHGGGASLEISLQVHSHQSYGAPCQFWSMPFFPQLVLLALKNTSSQAMKLRRGSNSNQRHRSSSSLRMVSRILRREASLTPGLPLPEFPAVSVRTGGASGSLADGASAVGGVTTAAAGAGSVACGCGVDCGVFAGSGTGTAVGSATGREAGGAAAAGSVAGAWDFCSAGATTGVATAGWPCASTTGSACAVQTSAGNSAPMAKAIDRLAPAAPLMVSPERPFTAPLPAVSARFA